MAVVATSSCIPEEETIGSTTTGTSSTTSTAATIPGGAMAAKFIMRQANPSGSFGSPPTGGTVTHEATRVFNADGSLLAEGTSDTSWPDWISSFAIGISGSSNTNAPHPNCARFASGESATQCDFNGDATFDVNCGTQDGLFRVSEYDCSSVTTVDGTGASTDGIHITTTFNRDTTVLGSGENIQVVIEYQASALSPAPSDPSTCFSGSVFDPTADGCSDFSWQIFLKQTTTSSVQPFLTLVPPAFASIDTTQNTGGSGVATKTVILPLAADSDITIFKVSRIKGQDDTTTPTKYPLNTHCVSNSPLCMGMVIYSVTFYRI